METIQLINKAKRLKKNDEVKINKEIYKVFNLQQDVWYDSETKKIIEKYPTIFMYKIPIDKKRLIPLWYILKIDKNKIKFSKELIIENKKEYYPEDFPKKFKHKLRIETKEIKIKSFEILK